MASTETLKLIHRANTSRIGFLDEFRMSKETPTKQNSTKEEEKAVKIFRKDVPILPPDKAMLLLYVYLNQQQIKKRSWNLQILVAAVLFYR
ncbi:hypothetical protein J6590_091772 [Homalodisca vitripennis]|nr:hypothetical protein J6590_091772 [Homalodisca vitripennis]